jgi:hypothetical protein
MARRLGTSNRRVAARRARLLLRRRKRRPQRALHLPRRVKLHLQRQPVSLQASGRTGQRVGGGGVGVPSGACGGSSVRECGVALGDCRVHPCARLIQRVAEGGLAHRRGARCVRSARGRLTRGLHAPRELALQRRHLPAQAIRLTRRRVRVRSRWTRLGG